MLKSQAAELNRAIGAAAAPARTERLSLTCHASFEEAKAAWRAFEATAAMSPYQTWEWMEAWYQHIGKAAGVRPLIVVGRIDGETALILPLCTSTCAGAVTARYIGGQHVNYAMPLVSPAAAAKLDVGEVRKLLHQVAELSGGVDLFCLTNQPPTWRGVANPLARLPSSPSPSPAFAMPLQADFDALFAARRSRKARHALRRKERRLEDAHGPVEIRTAASELEVSRVRAAFFRQRARRFREIGVASVFDRARERGFVSDLMDRTVREGNALLRLDYLKVGDDIAAIYGGVVHGGRYTGYINSIEADYVHFSPGDILLAELIRRCCEEGLEDFDLGIGGGRYKEAWCDADPLVDVMVPMTWRGQLMASAARARRAVRSTIKNNPRLWELAQKVRKAFGPRRNRVRPPAD